MNKHTPGPWTVEPRQWDQGASLAIVAPHNGWIVGIVPFDEDIQEEDEPDMTTVIRHPDEEPNARLMAEAPTLYTDLQNLLEWAKGNRGAKDKNPYSIPEVKQALTTLARIQGHKSYLDAETV